MFLHISKFSLGYATDFSNLVARTQQNMPFIYPHEKRYSLDL